MKKLLLFSFLISFIVLHTSCNSMDRILYQYSPDIQSTPQKMHFDSYRDLVVEHTIRLENKIQYPVRVKNIVVKVTISGSIQEKTIPGFTLKGKEVKIVPLKWKSRLDESVLNQKPVKIRLDGKAGFVINNLDQVDLKSAKEIEKEFSSEIMAKTPAFPKIKLEKVIIDSIDYLGANLTLHILTTSSERFAYQKENPRLQIRCGSYTLLEESSAGKTTGDQQKMETVIPVRLHFLPLGNSLLKLLKKGKISLTLSYSQKLNMDGISHDVHLSSQKDIILPPLPSVRYIKTDYQFQSLGQINLNSTFGVKNHSKSVLQLNGLSYNILLNENVVVSGKTIRKIEIPAEQEKQLSIRNTIPLNSFWKSFLSASKDKEIRLKIQGKTGNINGKIPAFSLPIEREVKVNQPVFPKIRFSSFRYHSKRIYPPSVTFILNIVVENENPFPISIDMLRGDLLLNNESLSSITKQRIKIYSNQTKSISIPVTITGKNVLNNLDSIKNASKTSFQLNGSMVINAAGIPIRVEYP